MFLIISKYMFIREVLIMVIGEKEIVVRFRINVS